MNPVRLVGKQLKPGRSPELQAEFSSEKHSGGFGAAGPERTCCHIPCDHNKRFQNRDLRHCGGQVDHLQTTGKKGPGCFVSTIFTGSLPRVYSVVNQHGVGTFDWFWVIVVLGPCKTPPAAPLRGLPGVLNRITRWRTIIPACSGTSISKWPYEPDFAGSINPCEDS